MVVQWLRIHLLMQGSNAARDVSSNPGQGTKIPLGAGQLSLHATTREKSAGCSKRFGML